MDGGSLQTLARYCDAGVCHCDWRLTIVDCEEATAMWYINIVVIIISGIAILIGVPLTYYRLAIQGHPLTQPNTSTNGFLRPRPVDCMLIMLLIFNIFRLIDGIVLITDQFPKNLAARGFLFELSYAFGLGGITLYLIGVAQTISQSQSLTGWLPSPLVVDILGTIAILFPFLCTLPITIAGGAKANSNLPEAETLVITANATWFVSAFTIGCGTLIAAIRLVRILENQHKRTRQSRNHSKVKAGILRIQLIAATFVICLWIYSMILMAFVARRRRIIDNTVGSIIISVPWVLLGGLTTIAAQVLVIINPKMMRNAALKSRSSAANDTTTTNMSTHPDQRFDTTMDVVTTVFHDESHNEAIMNAITKDKELRHYGLSQMESGEGSYTSKKPEELDPVTSFRR